MFRHPEGGYQKVVLGLPPSDGERDVEPFPGQEIKRTRDAANLVLHDVEVELGPRAVEVVVGSTERLDEARTAHGLHLFPAEVYGWVFNGDGSAIGIWHPDDLSWPDLVVSVAEVVQEGVIEGAEHWGVAFPMCRVHPQHPMDALVVEDTASWVCPKADGHPIPIGNLIPIKPV